MRSPPAAGRGDGRLRSSDGSAAANVLLTAGSLYTAAFGVHVLGQLVALPVLTRLLSPEQYGALVLALVISNFVAVVGAAALGTAVVRSVHGTWGPDGGRALLTTAVGAVAALAAVAIATQAVWGPLVGLGPGQTLVTVALLGAPAMAFRLVVGDWLRAHGRDGLAVGIAVAAVVVGQAAGLALLWWTAAPELYLIGLLAGNVLAAIAGCVGGAVRPTLPRSRALLQWAWRFSAPLTVHKATSLLLDQGDRLVVAQIAGTAQAARYAVAYAVANVAVVVTTAMHSVVQPALFAARQEDRHALIAATRAKVVAIAAAATSTLALLGPPAVGLLTPSEYDALALAPVVALVALCAVPHALRCSAVAVLFERERTAAVAWRTASAAAASLALCAAAVARWGLVGAAVAALIGYLLQAVLVHSAAAGEINVPVAAAEWRAALLAVAAAAAGATLPLDRAGLVLRVGGGLMAMTVIARMILRAALQQQRPMV